MQVKRISKPSEHRSQPQRGRRLGFLSRHWLAWGGFASGALLVACAAKSEEIQPEELGMEFISALLSIHGEVEQGERVVDMLCPADRNNLAERAERASAALGRRVAPAELIAPSRFHLAFEIQHRELVLQGEWAQLKLAGEKASSDYGEIRMHHESDGWCVILELPEPPVLRRRESLE